MEKSGDKQDDKQNNAIVSFRLNALASNIFAIMAPALPAFMQLPKEIIRHVIASYLNPADKLNLALSYKENLRIMKPELRMSNFLHCVARGQQDEAERLLNRLGKKGGPHPDLLLEVSTFTDYSGRTFECTAYEYAYWAKDTYMCRMLEAHMDEDTKAAVLKRCETIEKVGLTYTQHGQTITGSKHFDLTPLKTAYEEHHRVYTVWKQNEDYSDTAAIMAAWMNIGVAQRDLPVHVINEYCRRDRTLWEATFKEDKLPRTVTYTDYNTCQKVSLYPLVISDSSGLGVNFALFNAVGGAAGIRRGTSELMGLKDCPFMNIEDIIRLDKVRTDDLKQSLEILRKPREPEREPRLPL